MTPLLGGLIGTALEIIGRVLPDPQAKAAAQIELIKLQQAGEFRQLEADLQMSLGQLEVNKVEAASPDLFRGGWRPAVGWTCVAGLAYQFLVQPILPWLVTALGGTVPPLPAIDNEVLFVLLTGMLGFGGMRTAERLKGKA